MKKNYSCPVCSGKKSYSFLNASSTHGRKVISNKDIFHYAKCARCSCIFLTNITVDGAYYKKYYTLSKILQDVKNINFFEKLINIYSQKKKQRVLQIYKKNKKNKVTVLDVGCGTGEFLASLDGNKYDKYGIELNKKEFKKSKEKNLTIYNDDILKKDFGRKKFDIITLWHVIEHIPDPQKLMEKIKHLLMKNGIIIVATPNINSTGFKTAKENWFHMDAPRHLILFNNRSIRILCKKYKLKIKKIYCDTFEFPLDLYWSIKRTGNWNSALLLLLYPYMKFRTKETLIYILK